jgi:hypothetical protein
MRYSFSRDRGDRANTELEHVQACDAEASGIITEKGEHGRRAGRGAAKEDQVI